MEASFKGVATVIGAGIIIVTVRWLGAGAVTQTADVHGRTGIAVVTSVLVEGIEATRGRVTGICGARILVITESLSGSQACSVGTDVTDCTGVSIVARNAVGGVDASAAGIADIIRTGVGVITIQSVGAGARAVHTRITGSTHVSIAAGERIWGVYAPGCGVA